MARALERKCYGRIGGARVRGAGRRTAIVTSSTPVNPRTPADDYIDRIAKRVQVAPGALLTFSISPAAMGVRSSATLFYSNRFVSQAGQGLFLAGLFLLAGTSGSQATGLTSLFVAMMAGSVLCGLPGGALADRLGPGNAIFAGAAGRALVIAAALLLPPDAVTFAVVAFAYSAVSQLFSPAELALVGVVAPARPSRGHALLVALQHAGQALGMLILGPACYALGGAEAMIATACALYLLVVAGSGLLAFGARAAAAVPSARNAFTFRRTMRFFSRRPRAASAAISLAFAEVASKTVLIALPAYMTVDLGLTGSARLALVGPAALGAAAGLWWAGRNVTPAGAGGVLRLAILGSAVSVIALATLGAAVANLAASGEGTLARLLEDTKQVSVVVAVPVALLLGACFTLIPIAARTVLTATAPSGHHARVFAMQATFTDVLSLLPLLLFGASAELAGARTTLLFVGLCGVGLLVAFEYFRMPMGVRRRASADAIS